MPDDGRQRDTTPNSDAPAAAGDDALRPSRSGFGRIVRTGVLLLIVLVAVAAAGRWMHWQWSHISEFDARIASDMIVISSRVSGWIVERPVKEGDRVAKGDVLAVIDARDAVLQIDQINSRIAGIAAQRDRLGAERSMLELTSSSRLRASQSRARAAEVAVGASREQEVLAQADYDRVNSLRAGSIVSQQRVDTARIEFSRAAERHLKAQAELAEAQAGVAEARAELGEILVLDHRSEILRQNEAEQVSRRERLLLDVSDRTIRSPLSGVISQVFVDNGEHVSPGQRLMLVHDPDAIYVEANIKETELRHIAPGMPVAVNVDAYPDRTFTGRIERIGEAATSEFALLPNPNPSGNFTKVTQRLPVRISVDQIDGLLRPGMMVVVDIEIPGR